MESKRRSLQLQPLHLLTSSSPPPSPAPRRQSSINIPYRPERHSIYREPVTLAEKHADLLHFIAQKESKCLELRSQLAVHEAELLELKRKWERIVSRGFERQQASSTPSTPLFPASSPAAPAPVAATPTPPTLVSVPAQPPTSPNPISAVEDISSWITTNMPKKWDTATISKRASMFGQSIAQALDLGETTYRPLTSKPSSPAAVTSPTPPLKPSLSRTGSSARNSVGKTGSLRASKLNTSHSPTTSTSTLTDSPIASSPTSTASKRSSPTTSPTAAATKHPSSPTTATAAGKTTSKQPTSRTAMSLTRTAEEEEDDEAWNW
ncbi:hypothetical protein CPB85DRAFT_1436036 [Mucidula mucida]|nr:hypothetical protein CPB85DRAFT_1436036 [Mucidula mucida]